MSRSKSRPEESDLKRLESLAELWDSRFRIPGTRVRFGLDSLLGLIPGVGDVAGLVASGWMIFEARRLGVGFGTRARMAGIALLDLTLGSIPILGDAFDLFFRSNQRMHRLLTRRLQSQRERASRAETAGGEASGPAARERDG